MRSIWYDPYKDSGPVDTVGHRVEVYEILIDGPHWSELLSSFRVNGFTEIPDGVALIDKQTGMIRLRLASLIEGE